MYVCVRLVECECPLIWLDGEEALLNHCSSRSSSLNFGIAVRHFPLGASAEQLMRVQDACCSMTCCVPAAYRVRTWATWCCSVNGPCRQFGSSTIDVGIETTASLRVHKWASSGSLEYEVS